MLRASLKELGSTNIGIAGVNTRNVQLYQAAIKGLSAEQAVFALSTKGATDAQIKHIMLMETSTLAKGTYTRADIQASLAKYGLIAATSTLTVEQQKELVNSGLLSSAKMAEMASVLGLSTTENGALISKEALNAATVRQKLESIGIVGTTQAQIISILGLTAAEGKAVTVTNLLTASMVKLRTVSLAHPIGMLAAAIGVIGFGIVSITKSIHAADEKAREETRQLSIELTNTFQSQQSSLDAQIEKYKELKNVLDNSNLSMDEIRSTKEQLLEIQRSLVETYGSEASNIDLINGKYKEQLALLTGLSKSEAMKYVTENRDVFADAQKALAKTKTYQLGTIYLTGYNIQATNNQKLMTYLKSYSDLLRVNLAEESFNRALPQSATISLTANAETAYEFLHQFAIDLEKFGKENNIDVSSILHNISHKLKTVWTDELVEYKKIYDQFIISEIIRNDNLRPLYQQSIQAVEDYNQALSSGEGVAQAEENLKSLQQSVQEVSGEVEGSQEVFDSIYDNINRNSETAYHISSTLKKDKTIQGYAEQLRGLTDMDLQAINFNNRNPEKGEDALRTLKEALDLTEEQIPILIDALVELGYVQGKSYISLPEEEIQFLNIPDTINHLNTHLKPALDSIQSAYQDIFTENGMELDNLDLSTLTSLRSAMEDIEIDSSPFNEFLNVLIDVEATEHDVQEAFDQLADTITHTSLSGLEDFDTLRFSLKSMGIENSEIVAFKALINNTEALAEANFDLNKVTMENVQTWLNETVSAENMAEAMELLTLRTILYNATNLDNTQDINTLYQLAQAAGIATDSVFQLLHMKSIYTDAVESGNTAAAVAAQHRINSLRQEVENQFANLGKTNWNGGAGSSDTSPSSTADTYLEAFEKELEELDRLKSENKLSEKQYLDALRKLYIRYFRDKEKYIKEYSKYEYQYLDGMKSLYESAFSYISKQIDRRIDAITKEKEAAIESLETQKEAAAQTIQTQIDSIDEQIDLLDQLIEKKQEEIDAIQKAADARQREIDLQKAQYELERMQHQRTTLVYREGQGLVYEADTTGIREAREQVEDAKREIRIAAIETEIDGLEKQQDALNDQRELLEKLLEKSNEYYDDLIGQTEERFDTLISNLEDYQNQFDELSELEENTRQENNLDELNISLGDILAGSSEAFAQIMNAYQEIIKQIYQNNPSILEKWDKLVQQISQADHLPFPSTAQEAAFSPDLTDTEGIPDLATVSSDTVKTTPDFSSLKELQPGDRMYELLQKAEAYFSRTESPDSPFSSTVDKMAETLEKTTMVHLPAEGIHQSVTVNFGDIHLHEVQQVDTFADELCMRLPNLMLQKTRSLY